MNQIVIENLSKSYDENTIFSDVNMIFEPGKIYGLIGRNGSGKTLLLKCICGFVTPDTGVIKIDNKLMKKDCEFLPNAGFLIEQPGFLNDLSGYSNLKYIASIQNIVGKREICDTLCIVGLDPKSKKKVGNYSLGMKQRLGIAQAIMEDPNIIILDEPMNGLDDSGVKMIRNILLKLKQEGKLIIVASHYKEDIDLLCDEVLCCSNGRILKQ